MIATGRAPRGAQTVPVKAKPREDFEVEVLFVRGEYILAPTFKGVISQETRRAAERWLSTLEGKHAATQAECAAYQAQVKDLLSEI